MSRSSRPTPGARATVRGAVLILVEGAVIGLAANAVNPGRLAWIRVPISETRRTVSAGELLSASPPTATPRQPDALKPIPAGDRTAAPPAAAGSPTLQAVEAPNPAAAQPPVAPPASTASANPASWPRSPAPQRPSSPVTRPKQPVAPPSATPTAQPAVTPAVKPAEALFVALNDAKALFDAKQAVFVDARHHDDYGAEHIAGAVSLFVEEFDQSYDGALGSIPKHRTIVTYCSDAQCEAAVKLADALVARGHTRVFILLEGLPGWKDAGNPTAGGSAS